MKILLVSQMYPGPSDPDLGVFVLRRYGARADVRVSQSARGLDPKSEAVKRCWGAVASVRALVDLRREAAIYRS